jgi:hypothetical protein
MIIEREKRLKDFIMNFIKLGIMLNFTVVSNTSETKYNTVKVTYTWIHGSDLKSSCALNP